MKDTENTKGGTERLLSLAEVARLLGVCSRTVRRLIQKQEFPKPVKIGACLRFYENEIRGYIEQLKERRV